MALQLILTPLLLLISPFSSVATASLDGITPPVYVADNEVRWTLGYMNMSSYDPRGVGSVGMVFFFPRNEILLLDEKHKDPSDHCVDKRRSCDGVGQRTAAE